MHITHEHKVEEHFLYTGILSIKARLIQIRGLSPKVSLNSRFCAASSGGESFSYVCSENKFHNITREFLASQEK